MIAIACRSSPVQSTATTPPGQTTRHGIHSCAFADIQTRDDNSHSEARAMKQRLQIAQAGFLRPWIPAMTARKKTFQGIYLAQNRIPGPPKLRQPSNNGHPRGPRRPSGNRKLLAPAPRRIGAAKSKRMIEGGDRIALNGDLRRQHPSLDCSKNLTGDYVDGNPVAETLARQSCTAFTSPVAYLTSERDFRQENDLLTSCPGHGRRVHASAASTWNTERVCCDDHDG